MPTGSLSPTIKYVHLFCDVQGCGSRVFQITFASPAGPNPPVDPSSVEAFEDDDECVSFLEDETVTEKFEEALLLENVKAEDYDVIYYVGG